MLNTCIRALDYCPPVDITFGDYLRAIITAEPKMIFRGGCTLILDLNTMQLRDAIKKDIADEARLERQRQYRQGLMTDGSLRATYFKALKDAEEPFALLHRSFDSRRP